MLPPDTINSAPLVSVVLPTYNRAHVLARAMRSVLNQSYRNLELIVVDDGSTDRTEALVREFDDPRLRYIRRANGGPAAARNAGLREARGELVSFQDSDDEWLDGKLERQVQVLRTSNAVLCVCAHLIHFPGGRPYLHGSEQLFHGNSLRMQALENFFFPTPTWLVRRDALERVGGFDENLRCWEDWELAIRLSDQGEFAVINEALHLQHADFAGVNRRPESRMRGMRLMLERHAPRWTDMQLTYAQHCYTVGRLECLIGDVQVGRTWLRRALSANPRHLRAWALFAVSHLGAGMMRRLVELRARLRRRPEKAKFQIGSARLD